MRRPIALSRASASRLLADEIRIPVERIVSEYYGAAWQATTFVDLKDRACHPAGVFSDGTHSVFVKFSAAAHGAHQFEVELSGLRLLSERAHVLTPVPVGIVPAASGVTLVLEAVQERQRTAHDWREIGRTLARIHLVKADRCGFNTQGYFGPLYQDNRPMQDWLSFYLERRLWPRFMGAIDSGHMPTETIRQVEKLIARIPGLDIPPVEPSLLHGDAQQNNFISTTAGALVIDPAVYYGNPEMDLAYVDYFQPVPADVFHGYREILQIHPGFEERRDLWRIPAYLAAVTVEGAAHLPKLVSALRRYL